MAVSLDVLLERSKLPTFITWSKAISNEGFPLSFLDSVDLTKHTGYIPAVFRNDASGFEFYLSRLDDVVEVAGAARTLLPTADAVAWFRFTEKHEYLAATVAAAVLAQLTNGVFDPQDGRAFHGKEAIAEARRALDNAVKTEELEAIRHPEILSPANWATAFEESLRRVHHDYNVNEEYRGRELECVREDVTGLFLSQSCVETHDRYQHCFAVLFTRAMLTGRLCSPFVLGSRFDHNATISHAYNREYRAGLKWQVSPREWHSEYWPTLRDARQWVETTARTAEHFLRPLYLSRLSRGAERVAGLFQDAVVFLKKWGVSGNTLRQPVGDGPLVGEFAQEFGLVPSPNEWNAGLLAYFNALRLADANGFPGVLLLKHRRDAFNTKCDDIALGSKRILAIPKDMRNAAIFAAYIEEFLTVQAELPMMLVMIENVKSLYPSRHDDPTLPQKPWWRLW